MNILGYLASLMYFRYFSRNTTNAATPVINRPWYRALAQEVEAMAAQIVPRFHGEARDDVQLLFDGAQSGLEVVDITARRINGGEHEALAACLASFEDTISELHHYEVDKKIISRFQEIHSDLNAWAGELRARGHAPSGPASPPV